MLLHNFWSALVLQGCCQTILFLHHLHTALTGIGVQALTTLCPQHICTLRRSHKWPFSNKNSICALKILFGARKQC